MWAGIKEPLETKRQEKMSEPKGQTVATTNFTQAETSDMNLFDKRADFFQPVRNIFFPLLTARQPSS